MTRVFECKHCEGEIENPDNSLEVECPHCDRILFGCPVCGQPLKEASGSHFAFASPRSEHTKSKKEEFKSKIEQWKEDQKPDQRERSEAEIQQEWINQNESEYASVLTEVPVGKGRVSGQPRRIDIVAVREMLELPGHIGNQQATQGEQWLADEALRRDDYPTEKKLRQIISRHQGNDLEVEVYEVKTELNPRGLGQLLVYSHRLPDEYDLSIKKQGLIFGDEYRKDRMCAQAAKDHGIDIHRV